MKIPGFAAEASLVGIRGFYAGGPLAGTGPAVVVPADFTCRNGGCGFDFDSHTTHAMCEALVWGGIGGAGAACAAATVGLGSIACIAGASALAAFVGDFCPTDQCFYYNMTPWGDHELHAC